MSETREQTDPLLLPLADAQRHLLTIVGDALLENGQLDGLGLDMKDVLAGWRTSGTAA